MEVSIYMYFIGQCMKFQHFTTLVSSKDGGESVHAQTRQSLRCSHAQSMEEDESSDQNLDLKLWRYLCTEMLCIRPYALWLKYEAPTP